MTRFFLVTIILALMVGPYLTQAIKFKICDEDKSPRATIDIVKVSDCETTQDPCPFVRGTNKTIEIDFVPKQKIEQVKVNVIGHLNKLPVKFFVDPENACGHYGFSCPLEAGQEYKFKLTLPIKPIYPKINVDVFLRLLDEKDSIVTCIEMPAKIMERQKD